MQDLTKCSPTGRDCIEKNSAKNFNCSFSCEGIYADIQWRRDEEMTFEIDKDKYTILSSEYQNFKRENVKHFRFSSESSQNDFGKQILK